MQPVQLSPNLMVSENLNAGLTFLLGHSGFSKLIFGFFGQKPLILAENRRISAKIYTF